jgi:hypothetical protein
MEQLRGGIPRFQSLLESQPGAMQQDPEIAAIYSEVLAQLLGIFVF